MYISTIATGLNHETITCTEGGLVTNKRGIHGGAFLSKQECIYKNTMS